MQFRLWLEELRGDFSDITGDPYIDEEWQPFGKYLKLILRYRWPGYKIPPQHAGYKKPDEFGSLTIEGDDDGYYYVASFGIDKQFQKNNYGTDLMTRALAAVKKKGGLGIKSDKLGRTDDAAKFWASKATRSDTEFDYLEEFSLMPMTHKPNAHFDGQM